MNFCAIGPLCAAEIFKDHSHHMALAQYLYDEEYFNFMRERVCEGKFVVLDSGVYEGAAVPDRELLYWVSRLEPAAIVLPDKPHDMKETLKLSLAFAQKLHEREYPCKKWKVLHASNAVGADFDLSYIYDSRLFDGVCFSRLTSDFGYGQTLPRPSYIKHLQAAFLWNPNCYHHALGMNDGDLNEVAHLAKLGVSSIDSSAPIWRGFHGRSLPWQPQSFNRDFDPFFHGIVTEAITTNFTQVLKQCASK